MHRTQSDPGTGHWKYGRHGDLNPANILWYNNGNTDNSTLSGTLKITDFGQAEFNSSLSRTKQQKVAITVTYRPPECDLDPEIIRQTYDIWCMGCVFLEMVTWLLGGHALVTDCRDERCSYDPKNPFETDTFFVLHKDSADRAIIKPAVIQHFKLLHAHQDCTEFFHRLLEIIEQDMLVINSKKRESCVALWSKLDDLHQRCKTDVDYATKKNPRQWTRTTQATFSQMTTETSAAATKLRNSAAIVAAATAITKPPSRIPRPRPS